MARTPRVALFRSEDSEFAQLHALFTRHEYSLRLVNSAQEILELTEDEGSTFDAVVVGARIHGGASGLSACLNIRADPLLASLPLLALLPAKDHATIQSFFGAGADVVLSAPHDPDIINMQIGALSRQRRLFSELLQRGQDTYGLRGVGMQALHCAREAIIIFDPEHHPLFLNRSARILLGAEHDASLDELDSLSQSLEPLFSEAGALARANPQSLEIPNSRLISLTRLNQQSFQAMGRMLALITEKQSLAGFVFGFHDASEHADLTGMLLQAQRMRSLSLLTSAGSLAFLRTLRGQIPVAPLAELERHFNQEPARTELNATALSLLEVIDVVLNPGIEVKVKIPSEWTVALRYSDLFQLLGHVFLHAIEFAGSGGDTEISVEQRKGRQDLVVLVASESSRVTPLLPDDLISDLLSGVTSGEVDSKEKLLYGLQAAQHIADRYDLTLEYKLSAPKLKIRITLPLVTN